MEKYICKAKILKLMQKYIMNKISQFQIKTESKLLICS